MLQTSAHRGQPGAADCIESFSYPPSPEPPMPLWEAWGGKEFNDLPDAGCEARLRAGLDKPAGAGVHLDCERRLAEEMRRSFEAGRERGLQEGRAAAQAVQAQSVSAHEKARVEEALRLAESFAQERGHYFEAVEHEVVRLALAVAARILRREAQMDPLLLTGAVRVALGQLSSTTQVQLRVPSSDLELWTDTIAHLPRLAVKPKVVAGEGMRHGECVVETELGSVDLGVRAQLGEIERGFFDRAGQGTLPARTTADAGREMVE